MNDMSESKMKPRLRADWDDWDDWDDIIAN